MLSFRSKHIVLAISMLAVALMCGSFTAWSQATSGNIAGTVVDKSGSVIPNATVTATNIATGFTATVQASKVGDFAILNLPAGALLVSID